MRLFEVQPLFLFGGVEISVGEVLSLHHYIDPIDINNPNQLSIQSFILFPFSQTKCVMCELLCWLWQYSIIEIEKNDGQ